MAFIPASFSFSLAVDVIVIVSVFFPKLKFYVSEYMIYNYKHIRMQIYVLAVCVRVHVDVNGCFFFMQKGAALAILLAALLTTKAHDTKSNESNDEGWLRSTLAIASHAVNTSKSSAVSSDSVVVNWSSICTDLCG